MDRGAGSSRSPAWRIQAAGRSRCTPSTAGRATVCAYPVFCKKPGDCGVQMASVLIMRGKHVLTDPRKKEQGVIRDGAIAIEGDRIVAVGSLKEMTSRHAGAR